MKEYKITIRIDRRTLHLLHRIIKRDYVEPVGIILIVRAPPDGRIYAWKRWYRDLLDIRG